MPPFYSCAGVFGNFGGETGSARKSLAQRASAAPAGLTGKEALPITPLNFL
jgi:hypothetical protein